MVSHDGVQDVVPPGLDHAGIATQSVVERNIMKTEGKHDTTLGESGFWKELGLGRSSSVGEFCLSCEF